MDTTTAPRKAPHFRHDPRLSPNGIEAVEQIFRTPLAGVLPRTVDFESGVIVQIIMSELSGAPEILGTVVLEGSVSSELIDAEYRSIELPRELIEWIDRKAALDGTSFNQALRAIVRGHKETITCYDEED